ncbi:MAG: TlpA family protein disulfide reductase [Acidobacteria bacterium]|nr:TlpA family protein disulfide reductase [Acidobacteriota bacterium]
MRKILLLVAATTFSTVFAAGELSGRRAPSFALPDLNLNYHDIQDYRGKAVIVDIMRTTCPHCLTVSKNLEKIKAKFGTRVAIISIVNPPDNQQAVSRFLVENKLTNPVLFDCGQVSAVYLKVTPQNPSITIPHIFLIDPQGMIRNDFAYSDSTKGLLEGDGLAAEVQKLLGAPATAPAAKKATK